MEVSLSIVRHYRLLQKAGTRNENNEEDSTRFCSRALDLMLALLFIKCSVQLK